MALYIGLDLGTSGVRAIAIDGNNAVRATGAKALPAPQRGGERSEQDPRLWWRAVETVLDAVLRDLPRDEVAAIAADGTSATVLATAGDGTPLGPALMYNDTRARLQAERIAAAAPADSPARSPGSSLAKALYLAERWPDARWFLHQADWVANRLCGRMGLSDENNCLKLGFDTMARRWAPWLDELGLARARLPEVVPAGTALGPLADPWARRFGLSARTQVVAGTTDSTAAVLATGAAAPGDAVTSLGSTLVIKVVSSRPVFAAAHGVYSHRVGDLWLAGGASNTGGAVLLQHFTREQLERLTAALDPDQPTGLDFYPLPGPGERFPVSDPDLAPRLEPRPEEPAQFLQAMLEGMARIEAEGFRLLQQLGAPYPKSVRTVGGGAVNRAWTRIRQRLLGVPMIEPEHTEAAYGAALLARTGVQSDP